MRQWAGGILVWAALSYSSFVETWTVLYFLQFGWDLFLPLKTGPTPPTFPHTHTLCMAENKFGGVCLLLSCGWFVLFFLSTRAFCLTILVSSRHPVHTPPYPLLYTDIFFISVAGSLLFSSYPLLSILQGTTFHNTISHPATPTISGRKTGIFWEQLSPTSLYKLNKMGHGRIYNMAWEGGGLEGKRTRTGTWLSGWGNRQNSMLKTTCNNLTHLFSQAGGTFKEHWGRTGHLLPL